MIKDVKMAQNGIAKGSPCVVPSVNNNSPPAAINNLEGL